MKRSKDPAVLRLYFTILAVSIICLGIVTGAKLYAYYLNFNAPHSALDYYEAKRDFVQEFVYDSKDGGYLYWVERDGSIKDSRKYTIFQANLLLWAGGIQTQAPHEENIAIIERTADYLIKNLYKGNGEWYEYDERNHRTRQEFFWNPRNEAYVAYALMQAYRLTEKEQYLSVALETTRAQRERFPDAQIFADYDSTLDIGYRFPENTAHYEEYLLTGNIAARDWVLLYDERYRGLHGKEFLTTDGNAYYYHGMSVIDKLIYGFLSQNEAAYQEGSVGRDFYWSMAHDDDRYFNSLVPGESSDNGRDYYDKRLAMDMLEWTHRYDPIFQEDAQEMFFEIKRFWDVKTPGGFFINTAQGRKTCFTIGMPMMLIDLTAPIIVSYATEQKSIFNHQTTITVRDPEYKWNNLDLRGIGMAPEVIKFRPFFGFRYGNRLSEAGPCEDCVTYTVNSISLFPGKAKVYTEDLFANGEWHKIDMPSRFTLSAWDNLNMSSKWYYIILLIVDIVTVFTISMLFLLFTRKKHND